MATVTEKRTSLFGPRSAGIRMTPREFDRADFVEGWRYELINGVLVVSPIPSESEVDPNEELGRWLRNYQEFHPQGSVLTKTLPERTVRTKRNRRRADRVIWTKLGRLPRQKDKPTIIVEFVSSGKRNWKRDYEEKRDEYMEIRVDEYWVIDRFERTLTVFRMVRNKIKQQVISEKETYTTDLLPGFELPLSKLLALADDWPEPEPGDE
jgi:Uma2 family endonuclease